MLSDVKIKKLRKNPLRIQIETENIEYLKGLHKNLSDFVPNFQHMPQFLEGGWDGKTSMFTKSNRSVPYGLLADVLKYHKKKYPDLLLELDPYVKSLFRGQLLNYKFDLNPKYCPWDYQADCIDGIIKNTKGIIRVATAGGKSLIIAYTMKILRDFQISKRQIVIVPNTGLITQFVDDLIEYGIPKKHIGTVWEKSKQFDKPYVISTWQTLGDKRFIKFINLYNTIIVDETHQAKSHTLKTILEQATRAQYRLGFTGTLHAGNLDNWNVKAYLGPVIKDYSSQLLAKWGYVAKCNVNTINIDYEDPYDKRFHGNWATVRDDVFNNPYRMEVLKTLVKQVDSTCLLLVGRVDLEGKILKKKFKEAGIDKDVVFLSGKTATLDERNYWKKEAIRRIDERDYWKKEAIRRKDLIVIATYQIFQIGINIPPLKYLIMAAPFKSKIRVLQSIGRALRKHADKVNGAEIFDISDICKHFSKQADIRQRMYGSERFTVRKIVLKEGDQFDLFSSFPEIYKPTSEIV